MKSLRPLVPKFLVQFYFSLEPQSEPLFIRTWKIGTEPFWRTEFCLQGLYKELRISDRESGEPIGPFPIALQIAQRLNGASYKHLIRSTPSLPYCDIALTANSAIVWSANGEFSEFWVGLNLSKSQIQKWAQPQNVYEGIWLEPGTLDSMMLCFRAAQLWAITQRNNLGIES